jgi:FAD/FMN-containing dehydrogenase
MDAQDPARRRVQPFRPAASRSRAAEREQFGPGDDDGTRPPLELPGMAPTQQADKTVRDHQHAVTSVLGPWATGTILPGFADPPADTAERAYPAATRDRLRQVKARYDPDGILLHSFPLS